MIHHLLLELTIPPEPFLVLPWQQVVQRCSFLQSRTPSALTQFFDPCEFGLGELKTKSTLLILKRGCYLPRPSCCLSQATHTPITHFLPSGACVCVVDALVPACCDNQLTLCRTYIYFAFMKTLARNTRCLVQANTECYTTPPPYAMLGVVLLLRPAAHQIDVQPQVLRATLTLLYQRVEATLLQ